jgi:hypothetical protein
MKVLSLIITYMISTTMVLAQHTVSSARQDLHQIFSQLENVSEYQKLKSENLSSSSNTCDQIDTSVIIKKVDKRLAKARRSNETLSKSISSETKKFKRIKKRQARMTKRILKKQKRISKYYKKAVKLNPELTREEFVLGLRESLNPLIVQNGIKQIVSLLTDAGSMENYLLTMKSNLVTCESELLGDNSGLIYLIIFIGVPVLAIIASLVALIAGAGTFALWSFLGAIAILVVFFLIGNLSNKLFIPNKEEV